MLSNPHFHSAKKGCDIEVTRESINYITRVTGVNCKTHQVELCRCGWECGWHYGTYSVLLKGASKRDMHPLRIPYLENKKVVLANRKA